jgi:hypothetical protein
MKYRIFVKEMWSHDHDELSTCWVEVFDTLRKAQNRVKRIRSTDKWDCVGDWWLEVEGDIEVVQTA